MIVKLRALVFGEIHPRPCHYHVIDVMRGLAACSILLWHYQHFIVLGTALPGSRSGYPLYAVFSIFYNQGGLAVPLFWIISGFVLSAVYISRDVGFSSFFRNRFARLYPLHFVTLAVVAALQWGYAQQTGSSFLGAQNTPLNFVIHLFMASGWGFPGAANSFNGVIWSVSAEVLMYALFWLTLKRLFQFRIAIPLLASGVFFAFMHSWQVAACGAYFFMGCAVYVVHRVLPAWAQYGLSLLGALAFAGLVGLGFAGLGILFLFSGMVLTCAALKSGPLSSWAARVPWIADNTYGSYLWHIPVQITTLTIMSALNIDRSIALSPWFLFSHLAIVTLVARASFLFIERPARDALRKPVLHKPLHGASAIPATSPLPHSLYLDGLRENVRRRPFGGRAVAVGDGATDRREHNAVQGERGDLA